MIGHHLFGARGTRVLLAVTVEESLGLLGTIPQELNKRGVDVHVVFSPKDWNGYKFQEQEGVVFHEVRMRRQVNIVVDLISLVSWIWVVAKVRPDIVASGTPKAALLSMIAASLLRVPRRIYVLRGLRLETETGPFRKILILFERLTSLLSTEVLAVSHSLRDKYVDGNLNVGRRVTVLGFGSSKGVDTEYFKPEVTEKKLESTPLKSKLSPLIIGFAGRITPAKGPEDLLDAQDILRNSGHFTTTFFIGSLEDAAYADRFLRRVRNAPDSTYLGNLDDARNFYSLIDILCLPTRREGFPNVILEAASMGIPSITTDATGAVDSVVTGVTGVIVPMGYPDALAKAILGFISERSTVTAMGMHARNRAVENFSKALVEALTCDFLLA